MRRPSIAHGLFTWQDGRLALEACLRSTSGIVDHVLIADGLIDGVPDLGLPHHSDLSWLADRSLDWLPNRIPISDGDRGGYYPWGSISSACSWLLETARAEGADWLLFIDGDQELHNGPILREWLATWQGDAFPIQRIDGPGCPNVCPWQCVRVSAYRRYVAGCYVLERMDGTLQNLVPQGVGGLPLYQGRPWISHHPERRPQWRQAQRLGTLEAILEPPPPGVPVLIQPAKLVQSPAQ